MYRLCFLFLATLVPVALVTGAVYQAPAAFLDATFAGHPPEPAEMWLTGAIRKTSTQILGHPYPGLRIRYWAQAARSAWILEEIGKEKPITVGLVVNHHALERVRVLEFRESRGWEVRYPSFTEQFNGARLTPEQQLDREVDGISGATLSVRALEKLARLALYLDSRIPPHHDTPPQK
jgi:hypothetical protein